MAKVAGAPGLARACLAVACLLVVLAAVCAAQQPQLTVSGAAKTSPGHKRVTRGRVPGRAAGAACVPAQAPRHPGRFAGAQVNGAYTCCNDGINYFEPSVGYVPSSLATGNVDGASGVAIKDSWTEFGYDDGIIQTCLDITTAGLITLANTQANGSTAASVLSLASAAFAGCRLRYNGDSTYGFVPTSQISANGTVTLEWPQDVTALSATASWNLVDCPPCAGKQNGDRCNWHGSKHSSWWADASSLKRTDVDEATALSLIEDAADPSGRHRKHHKHACSGVCQNGVCVKAHHAKHCCHAAETYVQDAAEDDDADVEHKRKWHCWG